MMVGSSSGWLMLAGMMARPRADLVADEFGGDELRDGGAEILAVGAARSATPSAACRAPEILAMGDVDHLLGDEAGARELELGDRTRPYFAGDTQPVVSAGQARDHALDADMAPLSAACTGSRACMARPSEPRRASHAARTGGRPASRSMVTEGSVKAPEVS